MQRELIVLDGTGETRHAFDTDNAKAVAETKALFERLKGQGYVPFAPTPEGKAGGLRENFDPQESVIMTPIAYPG